MHLTTDLKTTPKKRNWPYGNTMAAGLYSIPIDSCLWINMEERLAKILTGPRNPNPVTLTQKFGVVHPCRPLSLTENRHNPYHPKPNPDVG